MSRTLHTKTFVLPPHANAETHQKIMAELERMTPDEFLETLVRAGIYDRNGKLLPPYADEEAPPKKTAKKTAPKSQKERATAPKTAPKTSQKKAKNATPPPKKKR